MSFSPTGGVAATNVQSAIAEVDSEKVAKAGDTMTGPLKLPDGSASAPTLANDGDDDTGIFFPAADTLGFGAAGAELGRWDATGLGLGTGSATRSARIELYGAALTEAQIKLRTEFTNAGRGGGLILHHNNAAGALPSANDRLGYAFFGSMDGATARNGGGIAGFADGNWSSSSIPTRFAFETAPSGSTTRTTRLTVGVGVQVGAPTGGDLGAGTLNAVGVYDDSSLLTCMALQQEFLEKGSIDLAKWDAMVPDLVIPGRVDEVEVHYTFRRTEKVAYIEEGEDGRLVRREVREEIEVTEPAFIADPIYDTDGAIVGVVKTPLVEEIVTPERIVVREHGTARLFKAMVDGGFDPREPEQFFAKMQADEALPGMPTKADWQHNGLSAGEMTGRLWLAMEMLAIVSNVMWLKLQDHEARLTAAGL